MRKSYLFIVVLAFLMACNAAPGEHGPDNVPVVDTTTAATPDVPIADSTMPPPPPPPPPPAANTEVAVKPGRNPASEAPEAMPEAMPEEGSADTVIPDKVAKPIPRDMDRASLAYKYPAFIRQNEVKDVWVYVKVRATHGMAKDSLKQTIVDYAGSVKQEDTINIYTKDIELYNNLTVTLQDPAKDFTIIPQHSADRQVIDTVNGNTWHWNIETQSDKKEAVLIIRTVTDNADGKPATVVNTRKIAMYIKLENTWLRKWYNWLLNNPEYVICTLLVPFIIFLYKRFFSKKKEE